MPPALAFGTRKPWGKCLNTSIKPMFELQQFLPISESMEEDAIENIKWQSQNCNGFKHKAPSKSSRKSFL